MTERAQVTALQCATMLILAIVEPAWLVAIPVVILSLATGAAIARRPTLAREGLHILGSLLNPPSPDQESAEPDHDRPGSAGGAG
jgi:hypothetical protein